MNETVLSDEQVKSIIKSNYVYFSAHVDDKTLEGNSSIGDKYMKIQTEKFQSNTQPNFFIVDENGAIIDNIGYTNKVEEFIAFLTKGIK